MTKSVKITGAKLADIINGTPFTREEDAVGAANRGGPTVSTRKPIRNSNLRPNLQNDGTRGGVNDGTRGGVIVGRRFPAIIPQRGGVIQNTAKNCAVFAPTRPLELQRRTSRPFFQPALVTT